MHPALEPHATGMLRVSEIHTLYWEESGNPSGVPVVFVHGGPGGGTEPAHRRFFDPRIYRIILFDQRGCGQSTPHAELRENTTWDLVADMERIRAMLGIHKWLVFGGSWGSTLALAYAQAHPEHVSALVLRGIFLCRRKELEWFYQGGCDWIFPDAWEDYVAAIPEQERGDLIAAYYKRLTSPDANVRLAAAHAWSVWEGRTSKLIPSEALVARHEEDAFAEAFARIECHYFYNACWFRQDDQLLADAHKIRHIPGAIVQGRYDVVCPIRSAWDLHRAWPEADLHIIADAGHSAFETGITARLVELTDRFGLMLAG
ncbi:MAG: prolyl aminopeptidase [Deltaproteobacteria bacterium]|nr:prolyl aminopeptidase [Deltaproteobacteria bacterium]